MASAEELRAGVQAILADFKGKVPSSEQPSKPVPSANSVKPSHANVKGQPKAVQQQNAKTGQPKTLNGNANTKKQDKSVHVPKQAAASKPATASKPASSTPTATNAKSAAVSAPESSAPVKKSDASKPSSAPAKKSDVPKQAKNAAAVQAPAGPLPQPDFAALAAAKMNGKLGVGEGDWYHAASNLCPKPSAAASAGQAGTKRKRDQPAPAESADLATMARLKGIAEKLLRAEVEAAEARKGASIGAEEKWMKTVLQGGTSSDKLAAMTLLVQQNALHSLKHLDGLLHIAAKKSRREAQQAIDALKDLFLSNLLPSDRKLVAFSARGAAAASGLRAQGGEGQQLRADALVWWLFEEELKSRYTSFLSVLQSHMADGIVHFKLSAMKTVFDLLCGKPESENALLSMLVNKMGDPEGKVASRAQYLLSQLVEKHEAMKPVVVREVRQFVYQPALNPQAQYYAVLFLNQLPLHRKLPALAVDLIHTYFSLFETCVKRNQLGSKLLSALLTGVNRAFPFTEGGGVESQKEVESRSDSIFSVVHKGTPSTAVQALVMLQQVAQRRIQTMPTPAESADAEPRLDGDDSDAEDGATSSNGNAATGGAPLAAAVGVTGDGFVDRFYRALYSKLTHDIISSTNKHALLLNAVYKSIKYDPHVGRARAMIKKLVQAALTASPQFAAGAIFLVSEVFQARPELATLVTEPEKPVVVVAPAAGKANAKVASGAAAVPVDSSDDSDESDSDESMDGGIENNSNNKPIAVVQPTPEERARALAMLDAVLGGKDAPAQAAAAPAPTPVDVPVVNFEESAPATTAAAAAAVSTTSSVRYDTSKREPKWAGADNSCIWELAPLATHFHPSVRKFADAVMSDPLAPLGYEGDPLADFTLMAFLDRYVYKNPKKRNLEAYGKDGKAVSSRASASKAGAEGSLEAELAEGYAIVQGKDTDASKALLSGLVHGTSHMQPRVARHGRVDMEAPATADAFAAADPDSIREEDRFMHTFFRTKAVLEGQKDIENKKKKAEHSKGIDGGELDESGSEADEDEEEAFAQRLAESLLNEPKGADDDDIDDDDDDDLDADADGSDVDDDEEDEEMDGGGDGDDDEQAPRANAGTRGARGPLDDDDDEESEDGDKAGNYADELSDNDDEFDNWNDDKDSDADGDDSAKFAAMDGIALGADDEETGKGKKKARTSVFASADDFAEYLQSDNEDDAAAAADDDDADSVGDAHRRGMGKAAAAAGAGSGGRGGRGGRGRGGGKPGFGGAGGFEGAGKPSGKPAFAGNRGPGKQPHQQNGNGFGGRGRGGRGRGGRR